ILAALQIGKAHVVGHDWGAALAWAMASFAPGIVDHLVVLSVGHPAGFMRTLEQRQKSWYMLLFQFPGVAESWLSANNWANFRTSPVPPASTGWIAELDPNGPPPPPLNSPRENTPPERGAAPPPQPPPVQSPTMGIWSTGDIALTEQQMTDSAGNVAGPW